MSFRNLYRPAPFVSRSTRNTVCLLALLMAVPAGAFALSSPGGQQQASGQPAGNSAPGVPPAGAVRVMLQPALDAVGQMIGTLDTGHWKAPGEVREETDRNVASIQRDLSDTLPGLLAKTDAAPGSAAAAFAVYRNVDALYDVLLRVEQTAELAASDRETSAVSSALARLESSRRQLGDGIATWTQNQERDLARLRVEAVHPGAPASSASASSKTSVVDDGPAAPASRPKKRKKPATQTPAQTAPAPPSTPSN
ncbi:hypothetical protein [Silvibacterium dinghuense]|uniref:Uncharacterized protein n=1 Tax=Silvibacterium dinghuense TaxID=1560006 RepID=A0A4V1NUU5_9BACT|nr:hypothetical protein [Silvibacterium dinghuense]RXS93458.1 hypothetical protein ESZ00_19150 [Silvibacterium dinghuense]GGH06011.1 hypothetical protein GCM10011586_22760 [Silvibacterium dinghuense]